MNEQKPIIVPEEIECSSGPVFSFNYKRVVYSLTMQPDKILLQSSGHPGILRDNTLRMPRDIL